MNEKKCLKIKQLEWKFRDEFFKKNLISCLKKIWNDKDFSQNFNWLFKQKQWDYLNNHNPSQNYRWFLKEKEWDQLFEHKMNNKWISTQLQVTSETKKINCVNKWNDNHSSHNYRWIKKNELNYLNTKHNDNEMILHKL